MVCTPPCRTCSDIGSSNCLSCVDEYYLSGSLCLNCKNGCLECDPSDDTKCTRCKDEFYLETLPDGTTTCEPCVTPCKTCLSKTFCYSCSYGEDLRI